MKKKYDYMIVGGYGVGNIGDEGILRGLISNLNGNIVVVSHNPKETQTLHKVDAVPPKFFKIIKTTLLSRKIIIGGGGIFDGNMGPYAKLIPFFVIFCKILRKKVYWEAIGIYPTTPKFILFFLKIALKISEGITLRDEISFQFVTKKLKIDAKRVPDPALKIRPSSKNHIIDILCRYGIDSRKKIVGIAPCVTKEYKEELLDFYIQFIERIYNENIEIILIPFVKHKYNTIEKDHLTAKEIQKRLPNIKITIIDDDLTPEEVAGIIQQTDFFLATRLHSLIFAYLTNTNFICIEYHEKCTSFLKEHKIEDRGIKIPTDIKQLLQESKIVFSTLKKK